MPLIIPANTISGYEVANSLRFDDGSSDYLNRTPSSASNRKTYTISAWIKRGNISISGIDQGILSVSDSAGANNEDAFYIDELDRLVMTFNNGGDGIIRSSAKLRDVSAWYHLVCAVDTTQSTSSNRVKLYINGEQVTAFDSSSYPSQNRDGRINNTKSHLIGYVDDGAGSGSFFDGYMAEVVLIDGSQLTPISFGEFDEDTGIWKPIDVSDLTFGTNGFYLDFEDSSALGNDVSGNNNDFTVNNLTSVDQTTDTCTNNFCTLNPLDFTGSITASEGNTVFQGGRYRATFGVSSGKWYWEVKRLNAPDNAYVGIKADSGDWSNSWSETFTVLTSNGNYYLNGSDQGSYGNSSTTNDILMFALDMDNGKIYIGENGTWFNSGNPATSTNPMASSISGTYLPTVINNNSTGTDQYSFNFGNPSFSITSGNSDANGYGNFEYAVPSGYYALNTKNLAEYG